MNLMLTVKNLENKKQLVIRFRFSVKESAVIADSFCFKWFLSSYRQFSPFCSKAAINISFWLI